MFTFSLGFFFMLLGPAGFVIVFFVLLLGVLELILEHYGTSLFFLFNSEAREEYARLKEQELKNQELELKAQARQLGLTTKEFIENEKAALMRKNRLEYESMREEDRERERQEKLLEEYE